MRVHERWWSSYLLKKCTRHPKMKTTSKMGVWCTFSEGTNSTTSHGLSWTLMVGSYVHIQAVFSKLHLSWPLMDSHGKNLCIDSSCFTKTPPLMASHGLSWTRMASHGLSWTLMDSHGLSWTLMDSHSRNLCIDSSCFTKTPPLMDSHGLSWTLMVGTNV